MALWNFAHETLGIHLYYLLALVIMAVMGISRLIQKKNQKNRDKKAEEVLNKSAVQEPAEAEAPASAEAKEAKEVENK